jgi:acyl-CoA dehydrogenase
MVGELPMLLTIVLALIALLALVFVGRGFLAWMVAVAVFLIGWRITGVTSPVLFNGTVVVAIAVALLFGVPVLRRLVISRIAMQQMGKVLPRLGDTERIALDAGTVWWDADLFSGRPDWNKLTAFQVPPIRPEEQAFIDNEVEELCRLIDDWEVFQQRDLPPHIWQFLKEKRFFGMIVPRAFGGLEMSHIGHARVVTKIASRSVTCAVTVMVPNSLGPAELLVHYGTEEQKQYFLPRLARGEEIPCFALTGPEAGSDAAATQSEAIVEHGDYRGKPVLGIRLNSKKRYITLAPVATIVGMAFRLRDPDRLLADQLPPEKREHPDYVKNGDLGITCALIPRDTPGMQIGERHDPMGVPFHNGPIIVENGFVPLDTIIGGIAGVGIGWRMLMESLAAGRSISLPALSVGAAQMATRQVGAYATVREQFDTPIGRFEGIEEPLARIGGYTYLMTAAQRLTCGALDVGEKPSVLSAIVKAYLTELMRRTVIDAMDIRAGAAIQLGPRNSLARAYVSAPIGITVEGANILTRSMIIYGQGAIRCHPFVQTEIRTIAENDLAGFDRALFGHVNFVAMCAVRSLLLGLTGGRLAAKPQVLDLGRFCQQLSRFSAAFALVSDTAMGTLGGSLKRREKISGRLADALAWMYLGSAIIKRYHDEVKTTPMLELARWGLFHALNEIEEALLGVIDNLPTRWAAWALRLLVFPMGAHLRVPNDRLGGKVARALLEDRESRIALTRDIFVPPSDELGLGRLEAALDKAVRAIPVETKLRDAVRAGKLDRAPGHQLDDLGLAAGVITQQEYDLLNEAREARDEVIQVDAFGPEEFKTLH